MNATIHLVAPSPSPRFRLNEEELMSRFLSYCFLFVLISGQCFAQGGRGGRDAVGRKTPAKPAEKKQAKEEQEMRIFRLQNISADGAVKMLEQLVVAGAVGGANGAPAIVRGPDKNDLIVNATPAQLAEIEVLLLQLDEDKNPSTPTQVIPLSKHVTKEQAELVEFLSKDLGIQYHLDIPNRVAVVRGGRKAVDQFQSAINLVLEIAEIDHVDGEPQRRGNVQLRVLWLRSNEDTPLPADVTKVVAPLERIGIRKLGFAGQSLANVMSGGKFRVEGVAQGAAEFQIQGQLQQHEENSSTVEISIHAKRNNSGDALTCESVLKLRPGQLVVLGMSPDSQGHSVFVVQMLDDAKE